MTSYQGSQGISKGRTASPMYRDEIEFIPDTKMVYIVPNRSCYRGIHTLNIFRAYSVLDFFAGPFSAFAMRLQMSKTANCQTGDALLKVFAKQGQ